MLRIAGSSQSIK